MPLVYRMQPRSLLGASCVRRLGIGVLCRPQDSKFWKLFKEDPPRCAVVLRTSVGLVHLLATLLEPFMPSFSQKV